MPAATTTRAPSGRAGARPGRGVLLVLALLLALLGLGGCSAGPGASRAADAAAEEAAPQQARAGGGDEAGGAGEDEGAVGGAAEEGSGADGDGAGGPGAGVLPGAATGRQVVTSSIDVAVEDVEAAAAQVRALAVRTGGAVAGESSAGGERPRAEIVLRVPTDDAADVMAEVAGLGEEVARTAESEPVETRLVDLESRTATQRVGVERIRTLLAGATTLEDVLALESELSRRQADLESVDAQRAALADLASLATVTVRLTTPEDAPAARRDVPPFLEGLQGGWEALGRSTEVVLVAVGALLPFVAAAAAVTGLVVGVRRTVRRRRPPVATAPQHPEPVVPSAAGGGDGA